jgi:transposase-like protein
MSTLNQTAHGSEQERKAKWLRRSAEEKRRIAEASLTPGASVHEVAQAYRVHPSQVGKKNG